MGPKTHGVINLVCFDKKFKIIQVNFFLIDKIQANINSTILLCKQINLLCVNIKLC